MKFAEDVLGIELLPWQRWLLIHALEQLPDGTFRFRTVVVLVARQNGKSTLAQILALFFMYVRACSLVIGTAQNLDIAEEVWDGAVQMAQGVPELAALIDRVVMVNGKKSLELTSGERYKVQTANRRGGRGLSGDLVILDELREHQNWDSWSAVTKTTLARPLAQVWALSNAGDMSSVVLRHLRLMAHAALGNPDELDVAHDALTEDDLEDDALGIFEWSAAPNCNTRDRAGWAQANPSVGMATITERAIASARQTDPEWVFRTEVLCQWVEVANEQVIPKDKWAECYAPASRRSGDPVVSLDVSPLRSASCLGVAGRTDDGRTQVEVLDHRPGTGWVRARAVEVCAALGVPGVVIHGGQAAESLRPELEAAGLEVTAFTGPEVAQACGWFHDAATSGALLHLGDEALDTALRGAERLDRDGTWIWARRKSSSDITPLYAVTLAAWGVTTQPGSAEPGVYFI